MIRRRIQAGSRAATLPVVLCSLGLGFAGCQKQSGPAPSSALGPGFNACQLLTNEDVAAAQGSPIKESKSSESANSGLRTWQCFYTATQSDKSVSLAVTGPDSAAPEQKSPLEFWEKTFQSFDDDKEKDKDKGEARGEREENEKGAPPQKIAGVGDEAFWSANRFGGALYALKKSGNGFVRISVGGPDSAEKKLEHSKALAEKALSRF